MMLNNNLEKGFIQKMKVRLNVSYGNPERIFWMKPKKSKPFYCFWQEQIYE